MAGTLGGNRDLDMWVARKTYEFFDRTHMSLPAEILDILSVNIDSRPIYDRLMAENRKYLMLEQTTASASADSASPGLGGLTEGDKLLQKILEPHRGRFVLIDIWGTWCPPCREALAHSAELYERLKEFDVVYVYLANNSPRQAWLNLIEEFNVKGSNVFHYNLPLGQQMAVENRLNVTSFPSYRLVDREGNVLDFSVDARIDGFVEAILRRLDEKK